MAKIRIKVTPNAKKEEIIEDKGLLKVKVRAPAVDGKANKAVVEALADYLKVKKSAVRILKGAASKEKIVEIKG